MNTLIETPRAVTGPAEAQFERRMERVMTAVDLHHVHLRDYLYQLSRQWQDAEDILSELWRYVLHHFPEDKIDSLSLLRRKAYQLWVDHYRASKRRPVTLTDELPEVPFVPRETAFSDDGELELKAKFWSEFHGIALSEPQKEVLFLHARYGFTYAEIEQQTGVPSSTVGDWIALGRTRILDYLNSETL